MLSHFLYCIFFVESLLFSDCVMMNSLFHQINDITSIVHFVYINDQCELQAVWAKDQTTPGLNNMFISYMKYYISSIEHQLVLITCSSVIWSTAFQICLVTFSTNDNNSDLWWIMYFVNRLLKNLTQNWILLVLALRTLQVSQLMSTSSENGSDF